MGKSEGEHNTIVGICDEIAQSMYQRGWLREVPGAGKTYIPTARGRKEIAILLCRVAISSNGDDSYTISVPGAKLSAPCLEEIVKNMVSK